MANSDRKIIVFMSLCCLCLCFPRMVAAHDKQDTLAKYSYRALQSLVAEHSSDSIRMHQYLNYYMQKARQEKHNNWIAIYYRSFVFFQKV